MILIFSRDVDLSTSKVIDWLLFKDKKYIRINIGEYVEVSDASIDSFRITFNDTFVSSNDITSCWFRKGQISIQTKSYINNTCEKSFIEAIIANEKTDNNYLREYIYDILEGKKILGNRYNLNNKIAVLRKAYLLGLHVPKTFILTNSKDIKNKFGQEIVVTKCLSDSFYSIDSEEIISSYTAAVSDIDDNLKFAPSLIQEKIKKKYEIRSFYLNGKFYSMAIINSDTNIDIRKVSDYNNRYIPFKLPGDVENKLMKLMDVLSLNTASIDLIKSIEDKNIYLLEVNPCGLFDNLSFYCNYNIEKLIADYLV